jgi:hypothetical protein
MAKYINTTVNVVNCYFYNFFHTFCIAKDVQADTQVNCTHSYSRNNQHNAQMCTTALFIYAGFYMFWQKSAIFRELLDPPELRENTDR